MTEICTELLSLSIHDDHMFGGSKIALHPEIFGNGSTTVSSNNTIDGSTQNGATSDGTKHHHHHSTGGSNNRSTDHQNLISSQPLHPGSSIEIRVWRRNETATMEDSGNMSLPRAISSSVGGASITGLHSRSHSVSSSRANSLTVTPVSSSPSSPLGQHHHYHPLLKKSPSHINLLPGIEAADNAIKNSPKTSSPHSSLLPRDYNYSYSNSNKNGGDSIFKKKGHVSSLNQHENNHMLAAYFVIKVDEKSLTSIKNTARTQISLLKQVADLYNISSFDKVTVTKVSKEKEKTILESTSADFVLVTIKDQFVSRGEMFQFQNSLLGKWLYEGERIVTAMGVKANAREIRNNDGIAKSGIVTEDTKITFRSRSARIIWLVQVSSEMWDYTSPWGEGDRDNVDIVDEEAKRKDADFQHLRSSQNRSGMCEVYFDYFITFMNQLFEKWKQLDVTHSLTLVFFSRTFVNKKPRENSLKGSVISRDVDGRLFQDNYKIIIDNETLTDWESIVYRVKKEFIRYPVDLDWHISTSDSGRIPSTAAQGNILEAINVTLNLLKLHYNDRDLRRTGNSIVIVTAGCGVFEVNKDLAGITKQRMMDHGFGSDMLSLGLPPLHVAPFFLYKEKGDATAEENLGFENWNTYFEVPHWMHLSFVRYSQERTSNSESVADTLFSDLDSKHVSGDNFDLALGANGFIIHHKVGNESLSLNLASKLSKNNVHNETKRTAHSTSPSNNTSVADSQKLRQRRLILGRNFDDILEACRPRYRGDSIAYIPSSLIAATNTSQKQAEKANVLNSLDDGKKSSPNSCSDKHEVKSLSNSPTKQVQSNRSRLSEWGSLNHNVFSELKHVTTRTSLHTLTESSLKSSGSEKSNASPSSSFNSNYSNLFHRSFDKKESFLSTSFSNNSVDAFALHIQPSLSYDPQNNFLLVKGDADDCNFTASKQSPNPGKNLSDGLLTSSADDDKPFEVDDFRALMMNHDMNVFACPAKPSGKKKQFPHHGHIKYSHSNSGEMSSFLQPEGTSSLQESLDRSFHGPTKHNLDLNSTRAKQSGIGAALVKFKSSNTLGSLYSNSDLRRIRTGHRLHSNGNSGSYTGRSSSKNLNPLSQSPPLKAIAWPILGNPHSPKNYSSTFLSQDTLLIPPSGSVHSHDGKPLQVQSALNRTAHHHSNLKTGNFVEMNKVRVSKQNHSSESPVKHTRSGNHQLTSQSSRHSDQKTKKSHNHGKGSKKSKKIQSLRHKSPQSLKKPYQSRRKPWILNPFCEKDEEDVLAKRTHNRRRWSHVFPPGEVEFKRHADPNWKSLCQPAILPLTVDYLPDPEHFLFTPYQIRLDAMDRSYYRDLSECLNELVTQRIIQDFQLITLDVIRQNNAHVNSEKNKNKKFRPLERNDSNAQLHSKPSLAKKNATIRKSNNFYIQLQAKMISSKTHVLSMGHQIHVLSYDPGSDAIDVINYHANIAQDDPSNTKSYNYLLWVPSLKKYLPVKQEFTKYSEKFLWNKVDNLICGDPEKGFTEGTRHRNLNYVIIPDQFTANKMHLESNNSVLKTECVDVDKEHDYVQKFVRLLEYIKKQQQKEVSDQNIEIVTSTDGADRESCEDKKGKHTSSDSRRFTIQLTKGKREKCEWMDIHMDPTFDTRRTFCIVINWLVASASKVEAQIQLLLRRCTQYGLNLVNIPQYSISSSVHLQPFYGHPMIPLRDAPRSREIEGSLIKKYDFVNAGRSWVDSQSAGSIVEDFDFARRRKWIKTPNTKQFIHRSGSLIVRALRDNNGWTLFILVENRRLSHDKDKFRISQELCTDLYSYIMNVAESIEALARNEEKKTQQYH